MNDTARAERENQEVLIHSYLLGRLMTNLHTLELFLRIFLHRELDEEFFELPNCGAGRQAHVGVKFPFNHFTNYDQLSKLINKFNDRMRSRKLPQMDTELVKLRHAIAHGRVFLPSRDEPPSLVKFSDQVDGFVTVEFCEVMSHAWLKEQNTRVSNALALISPLIGLTYE